MLPIGSFPANGEETGRVPAARGLEAADMGKARLVETWESDDDANDQGGEAVTRLDGLVVADAKDGATL